MALGATCVRSPGWKKASPGPGPAFVRRVFGPAEQAALGLGAAAEPWPAGGPPPIRLPARRLILPAKEAFLKAAGTGLAAPFSLCEIEAVRLPSGAPNYRFSGKTAEWVAAHHLTAKLSLSHDGGMALAFCTLEQLPPET